MVNQSFFLQWLISPYRMAKRTRAVRIFPPWELSITIYWTSSNISKKLSIFLLRQDEEMVTFSNSTLKTLSSAESLSLKLLYLAMYLKLNSVCSKNAGSFYWKHPSPKSLAPKGIESKLQVNTHLNFWKAVKRDFHGLRFWKHNLSCTCSVT